MNYKVSVIIPVYNVEPYLKRCLESVLHQTYENLEILLINDGSTDNSGKICDEYAQIDNRINVIHKNNGGSSSARNMGLDLSSGDYIAFVDSDDFVRSNYIEVLLNCCLEHNAEIAQCSFELGTKSSFNKKIGKKVVKMYSNTTAFDTRETKILAWGKIYSKSLFKDIRYPLGKIYDDEFTTYKVLYAANKIILTSEILYYYFQTSNSLCRGNRKYISIDFIEAYEERIKYFQDRNDSKMVEISEKELCIRSMLYFIKFNLNKNNENNKTEMIDLFKSLYQRSISCKYTSLKEKSILFFFNCFPMLLILIVKCMKIEF